MKKRKLLWLALIVLILNLVWEFSHYRLYNDLTGISATPHLILASFADMLLISGILIIVSLKNKNLSWIKKPDKIDYLLIIFLGVIIATTLEIINLNLGRWEYKEIMPTIFGIGLSPLIQLFTTTIISLIIIKGID